MKIQRINDLIGSERDVDFAEGKSIRFILKKDNMGFSLHKTIIPKGNKGHWHYKNHLEACYCIKGRGVITDLSNGNSYSIGVDDCYVLDSHDDHTFEALEDVVLISVFNPPVTGNEIHQKDGSYERI
jgi:L-ectoine synthase